VRVLGSSSMDQEWRGARLGDARLSRRLVKLGLAMVERPDRSFPDMLGNEAALEAAYRFFGNEDVTFDAVLEPHFAQVVARAVGVRRLLMLHDTSVFKFNADCAEDMGYLHSGGRGFYGHFSLAVDVGGGFPDPLGVLACTPWFRDEPNSPKKRKSSLSGAELAASKEERPVKRWFEHVEETQRRLGSEVSPIHVMDREADSYKLLAQMQAGGHRFVIRVCRDRKAKEVGEEAWQNDAPWQMFEKLVGTLQGEFLREVHVGHREEATAPKLAKAKPARDVRVARLAVAAGTYEIARPRYLEHESASLRVNVVRVHELDPPAGAEPIEWRLLTTEPIETLEDVVAIVDAYRARWLIEEYFKALKTGCAYPERRLESRAALKIALAVSIPVAWHLLRLRSWGRNRPEEPASLVLTPVQILVLNHFASRRLKIDPTVGDAMDSVASLGGHLRRNGPPGWQVLGRGWAKLEMLTAGWVAALRSAQNCDQS
jgi:hypothetical protein